MNLNRDISSTDKKIINNGISHLKKCIDICNELETDCLGGVLYAPWGQYKTREEGKENIEISLENLSKVGDGKRCLKEIDHSNIKLHFDTFHANIEEDGMAVATKGIKYLKELFKD